MNPDSILDSTKKVLGLDSAYTAFDTDVIIFVNSAFGSLKQLGVGSDSGFWIADNTTLWQQYTQDIVYLGMIQTFVFLKIKLAFDPPQSGYGITAIKEQIAELEFRINVEAEHINPPFQSEEDAMKSVYVVKTMNLAMAPTIVPDALAANTFYLNMTADATIAPPVNGVDGQHVTLEIISNGHTVTWSPGWNFGLAGVPSLTAGGKTDVISAVYRESLQQWLAGFTAGF